MAQATYHTGSLRFQFDWSHGLKRQRRLKSEAAATKAPPLIFKGAPAWRRQAAVLSAARAAAAPTSHPNSRYAAAEDPYRTLVTNLAASIPSSLGF